MGLFVGGVNKEICPKLRLGSVNIKLTVKQKLMLTLISCLNNE